MAVLLIIEDAPAGSDYDQWKIYRATSKQGTFNLIATQNLTDLSYSDEDGNASSWYKVSYYNSSTADETDKRGPIRGFDATYSTVNKVANALQMTEVTDSTTPSIQKVWESISDAEDEIDRETQHAWRIRYSGTESGMDVNQEYEYYDVDGYYEVDTGMAIKLGHRKIRSLSSSEGDALEVWDGSQWVDYLSDKTEGRNDDWWLEPQAGIIYLRERSLRPRPKGLRIKYRYGEVYVNRLISKICTYISAIDILMSDVRSEVVQEGAMENSERIDRYQKFVDEKLPKFAEYHTLNVTP